MRTFQHWRRSLHSGWADVARPKRTNATLSFGGYDGSGDLLPVTRLNKAGGASTNYSGSDAFLRWCGLEIHMHRPSTQRLIDEAVAARQMRLENGVRLPSRRRAMSQSLVRSKEQHVGEILREFNFADFESLSDLRKQAYVALRALSGLSVSANLFLDGWDTHSKNDLGQTNKMWVLYASPTSKMPQRPRRSFKYRRGFDFGRTTHYSTRTILNPQRPSSSYVVDDHAMGPESRYRSTGNW